MKLKSVGPQTVDINRLGIGKEGCNGCNRCHRGLGMGLPLFMGEAISQLQGAQTPVEGSHVYG